MPQMQPIFWINVFSLMIIILMIFQSTLYFKKNTLLTTMPLKPQNSKLNYLWD